MDLKQGLSSGDDLLAELTGYAEHLLEFTNPEYGNATLELLEVASAYLARAYDIERRLLEREIRNATPRGSPEQRFRTGPLASFIEQAKVMCTLGSRRLTSAQLTYDQEKLGRDL